ncbi:site-specific integrase [Sulfitobacter mediterraneus]|nr:site-specific integrase [Sulfitobacter mediterraneus]
MSNPILEQIDQRIRAIFQNALNEGHSFRLIFGPDLDKDEEAAGFEDRQRSWANLLRSQNYDEELLREAKALVGKIPNNPTICLGDAIDHACEGILRARLESDRILAARLRGHFHQTTPLDPFFAGMTVTDMPLLPGETTVSKMTLAEAANKYSDVQRAKGNREKTLGDFRLTMEWVFSAIDPDKRIDRVSKDDVRAVRDLLGAIPKNMSKNAATKDLKATDAAKVGSNMEKLAPKTQRKRLAAFTGLLRWAVSEGHADSYVGEGISIIAKAKTTVSRKPYSTEQLRKVFECPIYRGRKSVKHYNLPGDLLRKDYLFWVPLIALFSGMRAGEILQLTRTDIKVEDGVGFFDINKWDEVDKSLKTEASVRKVPIHSALLDFGFNEYVNLHSKGRIFAATKLGSDGTYSQYYSKQWRVIAQKGGFYTPQTVFHSFRHCFVDACRNAKMPENIAMQLVGHKDQKTHGGYGDGASLAILKEEIEGVSYAGLDLGHLGNNDWSY